MARDLTPEEYDREWLIELAAEQLFKKDYPHGTFARRLPQFKRSAPDPVGDHYRRLGAEQLRDNEQIQRAAEVVWNKLNPGVEDPDPLRK